MTDQELNAKIKRLQTEAVLAISHGTDEQSLEQINENHDRVKALLTEVVDALVPVYRDDGTEYGRGSNDVLIVISTRRKELGI